MDIYLLCLCLGFGGLLLMAAFGLGHHHAGHGGPAGSGLHGRAVAPAARHFGQHHPHAAATASAKAGGRAAGVPFSWLAWFSPRVLCSLALGFGAAGTLVGPWLSPRLGWPVTLALAAAGAWGFERGLVQPMWRFLFRFASEPARNLDAVVFAEGRAACNFDTAGHGLVSVQLDGQVRQLLGTLCAEDRARGCSRVRTGEPLCICEVDTRRNSCTVARLTAASAAAAAE